MVFSEYSLDNLLLNNGKNFVKALNSDKVLIEVETHSPDCSGYPTASVGKSFGARSNSGKREIAPKKFISQVSKKWRNHRFLPNGLEVWICCPLSFCRFCNSADC